MATNNGKNHSNGKNGGRPKTTLDWDLISNLAQIQCTADEIAFICKCTRQTLLNHCVRTQNCTFEDYLEKHRQGGKASLRRKQFELAIGRDGVLLRDDKGHIVIDEKGHPQWEVIPIEPNQTMLIWLGKQYLGQTDTQKVALEGKEGQPLSQPTFVFNFPDGTQLTPGEMALGHINKN